MTFVFQLIVLLFSVVIHEVAHGTVADRLGDPTARHAGRLTLNPIKHLDPFGSVILPVGLFFLSGGGFLFGWAKPVPFNPYNLKKPERDGALIAIAGPLSNLFLAFTFGFVAKATVLLSASPIIENLRPFFSVIILTNVALAVFNLVPLPPLDGSKIIFALLPRSADKIKLLLEQYGPFILLIFIFFGFSFISPIIYAVYELLA